MAKGSRRQGREAALQLLYALDAQGEELLSQEQLDGFADQLSPDLSDAAREFAAGLCRGALADLRAVDGRVEAASNNWRLARMSRVDRCVLRLGTHELTRDDAPPAAIIINEAVELAKTFGSETSGKFVNGVLARVAKDLSA